MLCVEILVAKVRMSVAEAKHGRNQVLIELLHCLLRLVLAADVFHGEDVVLGPLVAEALDPLVKLVGQDGHCLVLREDLCIVQLFLVLEAEVDLLIHAVGYGKVPRRRVRPVQVLLASDSDPLVSTRLHRLRDYLLGCAELDASPIVRVVNFELFRDLVAARLVQADVADDKFRLLRQAYPGLDLVKQSDLLV